MLYTLRGLAAPPLLSAPPLRSSAPLRASAVLLLPRAVKLDPQSTRGLDASGACRFLAGYGPYGRFFRPAGRRGFLLNRCVSMREHPEVEVDNSLTKTTDLWFSLVLCSGICSLTPNESQGLFVPSATHVFKHYSLLKRGHVVGLGGFRSWRSIGCPSD